MHLMLSAIQNRMKTDQIIKLYYKSHYINVHVNSKLGALSRIFHRSLEKRRSHKSYNQVLELGAGNLEHLRYIKHEWKNYTACDLRDINQNTKTKIKNLSTKSQTINFFKADATSLPFKSKKFDRVLATCLIVHLKDPYQALLEWQRVCKSTGIIDFVVPCDPGITTRLIRRFISQKIAINRGLHPDLYNFVNALEHISSFNRIKILAQKAAENKNQIRITYYPFNFLRSWNLNAYAVISLEPKKNR
jgi:phosphatidylethanolamine/phosphatidyl-N-methylethanolamine N-methyltransferase